MGRVGMNDLLEDALDAMLVVVVGPFFFGGFGLGPGSHVSRTSPSRGENGWLLGGGSDVGFRLVLNFVLGPIANVSNPTSSG